jgi:hypothetical protein
LKQDSHNIRKWLKSNYKQLAIASFIIVVSIGINAYIGLGPSPSDVKVKPLSNIKVNPFAMHISVHLNIIKDNKPVIIPSQIGIDEPLWNNHSLDKYGAQGRFTNGTTIPGMAPLYTNDNMGLIKIGSSVIRNYTLGDFFNIWGMTFTGKIVQASVNEKPISNFKNHVLKDGEHIHLNIIGKR